MAVSRLVGYVLYMFTDKKKKIVLFCHVLQMFTPLSNAKDCFVLSCATDVYSIISMQKIVLLSRATDVYYIISVQKIVLFCHVLQTFTTLSQCIHN